MFRGTICLNKLFQTKIYYSKQTNDNSEHKTTLLGKDKYKIVCFDYRFWLFENSWF